MEPISIDLIRVEASLSAQRSWTEVDRTVWTSRAASSDRTVRSRSIRTRRPTIDRPTARRVARNDPPVCTISNRRRHSRRTSIATNYGSPVEGVYRKCSPRSAPMRRRATLAATCSSERARSGDHSGSFWSSTCSIVSSRVKTWLRSPRCVYSAIQCGSARCPSKTSRRTGSSSLPIRICRPNISSWRASNVWRSE